MKTLVKLVNLHDGNSIDHYNGKWFCIESYPRLEAIVAAFYDDGWELVNRTVQFNPALQEDGAFSFYRGGWDFLFKKQVEDDEEDNGDEILQSAIEEVLGTMDEN
ncbi:MAG: hypothetical protein IJ899_09345 [Blautia sp.]|nr:hypothetical protein [Blautia sp.]